jgi:hypothetical protein
MRPFIPAKEPSDEACDFEKYLSSARSLTAPFISLIIKTFESSGLKSAFVLEGIYDGIDYTIISPTRHDDHILYPAGQFFDRFSDTEIEIHASFYEDDSQKGLVEGFFWNVSEIGEDPGLIEISIVLPGSRRNLKVFWEELIDETILALAREMVNVEKQLSATSA